MPTGKPSRLAEKLNTDMEAIRKEHADLTASLLKTFRTDIEANVKRASDTIATDTEMFLEWSGKAWQGHLDKIKRLTSISPWTILGAALALIAMQLILTYIWSGIVAETHMRAQLQAMGIQTIHHNGAIYLVPNPETASLRDCTMASETVSCIKLEPR